MCLELRATDILLILHNSLWFCHFAISILQINKRGSERESDLPRVLQLGSEGKKFESRAHIPNRRLSFHPCVSKLQKEVTGPERLPLSQRKHLRENGTKDRLLRKERGDALCI